MTSEIWYEHSLARIQRNAVVLGVAGVVAFLLFAGWRNAAGFACGAVISHYNFQLWKRIASAVGEQGGKPPTDAKAVLLGARYLLIGGLVFVTIKVLDVSLWAVLEGLLVTVAALMVELVRYLFTGGRDSR